VVIQVLLVADDPGQTTVSTSITVDAADPRWPTWLVDTVTDQAEEGARRLRDELVGQQAIHGSGALRDGFVPLAAVVPALLPGR
jgi:hypothetical protein